MGRAYGETAPWTMSLAAAHYKHELFSPLFLIKNLFACMLPALCVFACARVRVCILFHLFSMYSVIMTAVSSIAVFSRYCLSFLDEAM